MKRLFSGMFSLVLLLSACSSAKSGTQPPPPTSSSANSTSLANSTNCTDAAAFEADVTVPDNTNFKQGDAIHKVWRVKNTGTCAWNSQYTLTFTSGDSLSAPASTPLSATQPGSTLDIAVDLVAPSKDGAYRDDFEIHNPAGAAMPIDQAKTLWVAVTVGTVTAGSGATSSTNAPAGASGGSSNSSSGGAGATGLLTSTCAFTTDASRVNDVITAINDYRTRNGIPAYTVNPQLTMAAQSHSEDMACNNLFVHAGSDGSSPSSRVAAAGYSASNITENVYGSFPPLSGSDAVTWWATDRTDPDHNLNLISRKYTNIGVGYAFFNNFGYYVVDFASP
jgi:uncharacterized protein YkwD